MILKAGQIVKLKPLRQVMKEAGVSHWEHLGPPLLNSKGLMNKLFGDKVQIAHTVTKGHSFSAYDVKGREPVQQWSFHIDWIDEKPFEMELIQSELFEI
jgi:hypothetical protein